MSRYRYREATSLSRYRYLKGGFKPLYTSDQTARATRATCLYSQLMPAAKPLVTAPHLTVADVKGRSVIIHAGGDNYSDQPAPLGGGGARIACGVAR